TTTAPRELVGMDGIAEHDGDTRSARDEAAHRKRSFRAVNEDRDDRNLESFQQTADAWEEALELARGRASAFREPHEVLLAREDGGAKREARDRGAPRVN